MRDDILEASIRVLEEKFIYGQLMTLRFTIFTRMYIKGTELKDRDSLDVVEGMLRDQFSHHPNAAYWWRKVLHNQEQASA